LVATLPFPASSWLLTSTLSCLFPSTIHFTLKMEATRSSKMLVSYPNSMWCHYPEDMNFSPLSYLTNWKIVYNEHLKEMSS
jgi:hypothetical protein